ncbi:MAG: hypothetical protein JXB88_21920 [Spirochaetales bacterium]|nr:hypothetical protein [Spirochaetales bacterium]
MNNKFAFITHTIEIDDLKKSAPTIYNKGRKSAERMVEKLPPKMISHISDLKSIAGSCAEGWIISTWLFPNQYLTLSSSFVLKKILDAARLAEKLGAKIVGLGGYNSIVPTGSGLSVARNTRIGVTNGNSYTIATAIEGVLLAAEKMEYALPEMDIAVIGATGSIGSVISEMIAKKNIKSLTLVARNLDRLHGRAKKIVAATNRNCRVSTNIKQAVGEADIIFSASSSPHSIINLPDVKSGAIVCDVALPHDISVAELNMRNDILVFEGGLAKTPPGYKLTPDITKDIGMIKGEGYACFCETAILGLEGYQDHFSLNGISIENVELIAALGRKHGFTIADLHNKKGRLTDERIREIKRNITR